MLLVVCWLNKSEGFDSIVPLHRTRTSSSSRERPSSRLCGRSRWTVTQGQDDGRRKTRNREDLSLGAYLEVTQLFVIVRWHNYCDWYIMNLGLSCSTFTAWCILNIWHLTVIVCFLDFYYGGFCMASSRFIRAVLLSNLSLSVLLPIIAITLLSIVNCSLSHVVL